MINNDKVNEENKEIWRELQAQKLEEADCIVFGIPFDENCSCGRGASEAPDVIRELSKYLPPVTEDGYIINKRIFDYGNITKNSDVEKYFDLLCEEEGKLLKSNKFVIAIGGDHSVSIPLRKAFAKANSGKKIGLIHFDAHADFCDIYDDSKLSHASVNARSIEDGFSEESIMLVGIRSFEIQELKYFESHPKTVVLRSSELFEKKYKEIANEIKKHFKGYDAIYLSLDIDVLDPSIAPGTGTPETGGLNSRMLLEIIKNIMVELPIKAMDIVEVAPPRDINDITSWTALKIMLECVYYQNGGVKR